MRNRKSEYRTRRTKTNRKRKHASRRKKPATRASRRDTSDISPHLKRCKTVDQCIETATMDAYGEYEQASGWLTCLEEIFPKGMAVMVLGQEAIMDGLDIINDLCLVAVCRKGRQVARVPLQSVEFQKLSRIQNLWLKAWIRFAGVFRER